MVSDRDDDKEGVFTADQDVLEISLNVAERSLDTDLRAVDNHHMELDRSIRLGAASLGALLIVLGVFSTIHFMPTTAQTIALVIGVCVNLLALLIWVLVKAGIVTPTKAAGGCDPESIVELCTEGGWSAEDVKFSLIKIYTKNSGGNQRFIGALAAGRKVGILLWVGAVIICMIGFMMILRQTLLG